MRSNLFAWGKSRFLIGLFTCVFTIGCQPDPPQPPGEEPELPKPPGQGDNSNNGDGATAGDLTVLTEEWNANGEISWELSELLGTLSDTAYLDEAEARDAFKTIGFSNMKLHQADSTVAYVISEGPLTVVAFRGTDDVGDWFVNLQMASTDVSGGAMHTGFHDAYQLLGRDIQADIAAAKPKHLWITGHSLGGALAVVCAHQLHQQKIPLQGLVTFGQPMVAQAELVSHIDSILSHKYARFVNAADIVPRVPPQFVHAGALVWFQNDGFTHAKASAQNRQKSPSGLATQIQPPPPLSEEEFKKLQEQFRNKRLPDGEPRSISSLRFPFLDDHAMQEYLVRLGLKGEASSDLKAAPDVRGGTALPVQPELPKLPPIGVPPQRPGPPIGGPGFP